MCTGTLPAHDQHQKRVCMCVWRGYAGRWTPDGLMESLASRLQCNSVSFRSANDCPQAHALDHTFNTTRRGIEGGVRGQEQKA